MSQKYGKRRPRILVLTEPYEVAFFEKDIAILRKDFEVDVFRFPHGVGIRGIFDLLRRLLKTDLNLSWFAGPYAFYAVVFSRLFRRKSIVISGGLWVAPEDTMRGGFSRRMEKKISFIFRHAHAVPAVSKHLLKKTFGWAKDSNAFLIYHGFDGNKFPPGSEKENIALTVGAVRGTALARKGMLDFVRAAKHLPGTRFVHVGSFPEPDAEKILRAEAPKNVQFVGFADDDVLINWFRKAKVYVQASFHEGFGLSIAESMLCNCIPVVTERGAIPEVVGPNGVFVPYGEPEELAKGIEKAMNMDTGDDARQYILDTFPLKNREKQLLALCHDLLAGKKRPGPE